MPTTFARIEPNQVLSESRKDRWSAACLPWLRCLQTQLNFGNCVLKSIHPFEHIDLELSCKPWVLVLIEPYFTNWQRSGSYRIAEPCTRSSFRCWRSTMRSSGTCSTLREPPKRAASRSVSIPREDSTVGSKQLLRVILATHRFKMDHFQRLFCLSLILHNSRM